MSKRLRFARRLATLVSIGLCGCSTPPTPSAAGAAAPVNREPPLSAEACLLLKGCTELDSRPFEVCLVATPRCRRQGEVIYVRPDDRRS
jgi:hypothetical protein